MYCDSAKLLNANLTTPQDTDTKGEVVRSSERERQRKEEWDGKLKLAGQHSREGHGGVCSAFVIVLMPLDAALAERE